MIPRILVLGARGFIGRHLVEGLLRRSRAIPVAAARGGGAPGFAAPAETLSLDASDAPALRRAFEGVTGVVNCVAGSASGITATAQAIAEAIRASGDSAPRVVHLSSMAVYGRATGTVEESAELRADLDDYSVAKARAEEILGGFRNVVILRPGIVYGPRSPLWSALIARLLLAGRLGDLGPRGRGICNLLHVEDAVTAIERALVHPAAGGQAFNLAMDAPPTWNGYFSLYGEALGAAPLRRISTLRLAGEQWVIAPVLKFAALLNRPAARDAPPLIRPWLLDRCQHVIRLDVRRAREVLGLNWTALDSGLASTADWFRSTLRT